MLKKMAVIAVSGAFLLGWPCVAQDNKGRAHAGHNAPRQSTAVVPPTHIAIDTPILSPCTQQQPCWEKDAAAENPLPRWRRPEWVIVYVTIVYAFLAWLQWRAIKGQAKDSNNSAAATLAAMSAQVEQMRIQTDTAQTGVGAALEQLRVMQIQTDATQAKEQAQIFVTPSNIGMFLVVNTQFPFSKLHLVLENIGETRAYNLSGKYEAAAWEKDTAPPSQQMLELVLPQFVRPGIPAESASIQIRPVFQSSDIPRVFYLHIRGCIMYNDIFQPNKTRHTTFQYRCQFRVRDNSNSLARDLEWEAYGPDNHSS
jgi:hypothetical protein